jgi:hypothetical protein
MTSAFPPSFLAKGTFLWDELGYGYSEEPPPNLLTEKALSSDDGWEALSSSLEHAKLGIFDPLARLIRFVTAHSPPFLVRGIVELLGDAGPGEALRELQGVMTHEAEWLRAEACWGAQYAGSLWLVPSIVHAWRAVKRQSAREKISCVLSQLLEERPGPISDCGGKPAQEYEGLVNGRLDELRTRLGNDRIPIWEGRTFGVRALAERKYDSLMKGDEQESALNAIFVAFRHRFEASTGTSCSSMFRNCKFQPLVATAILEDFLASAEAERYEDGVRYFFRHRIPD